MAKHRRIVVSVAIIGTAAAALVAVVLIRRIAAEAEMRADCERRLQNLQFVLLFYLGNSRRFPPDIQAAVDQMDAPRWLLACPSVSTGKYEGRPGQCDYAFADWSREVSDDPHSAIDFAKVLARPEMGKYPIVFERKLTFHKRRGEYVITVDGTIIWDDGGQWLRAFASAHQKARLYLPD